MASATLALDSTRVTRGVHPQRAAVPQKAASAVHEGVLAVALAECSLSGCVIDERQPGRWEALCQGERRHELGEYLQGVDEGLA